MFDHGDRVGCPMVATWLHVVKAESGIQGWTNNAAQWGADAFPADALEPIGQLHYYPRQINGVQTKWYS